MATQVETQNKNDAQSEEIIPLRYSLAGPAVTNDTIIEWYKLAFATRQLDDKASTYIHLDIYGWTPVAKPARAKGGAFQGARAVLQMLEDRF